MSEKIDLRIIKTKKNLYNSILNIMRDKPFEEIKVSDICENALINRSTFYAHFNDKYELLYCLISDLKEGLTNVLNSNENFESSKEYYMKMIELFLNHIDENIDTYSAIIKNNKNSILMDMIYDTLLNDIKSNLKQSNTLNIPIDFVSRFYLSAVINVGIDYLRNPKNISKEKVIDYLNQLLPDNIY